MIGRYVGLASAMLLGCVGGPDGSPSSDSELTPLRANVSAGDEGCSAARWCWEHGRSIVALDGAGKDAVYAAGEDGTLLAWHGTGWRVVAALPLEGPGERPIDAPAPSIPSPDDLVRSLWVAAKDDVWVSTSTGAVWRYDGQAWTKLGVRGGRVRGSRPNDVWVGTQHFDGQAWHDRGPSAELLDRGWVAEVLPIAPGDTWALALVEINQNGRTDLAKSILLHHDGERWRKEAAFDFGIDASLHLVRGELRVHDGARSHRRDGSGWTSEPLPLVRPHVAWSKPPKGQTFTLYDGYEYVTMPADSPCMSATRIDAETSFCFGKFGEIQRFDGVRWHDAPQDRFGATLSAADWGRVPPGLWAGGARVAWGATPSDVWRVRRRDPTVTTTGPVNETIEHYDGQSWREVARNGYVAAITGTSAQNVWFIGADLLVWDGERMRKVDRPSALPSLTFTGGQTFGPDSALILGASEGKEYVLRCRGGTWSIAMTGVGIEEFQDVVGLDDQTYWVISTTKERGLRYQGPSTLYGCAAGVCRRQDTGMTWGLLELELYRGDLWLASSEVIRTFSPDTLALERLLDWPYGMDRFNELWVGADGVWLTAHRQALRYPLPR
jgi:hypothetical protein